MSVSFFWDRPRNYLQVIVYWVKKLLYFFDVWYLFKNLQLLLFLIVSSSIDETVFGLVEEYCVIMGFYAGHRLFLLNRCVGQSVIHCGLHEKTVFVVKIFNHLSIGEYKLFANAVTHAQAPLLTKNNLHNFDEDQNIKKYPHNE